MKLDKMKWTVKFRLEQVKAFCKLCGYNIRHKLKLEGDDGFYYHLQRETMKTILHADLEQEYLADHGLLPEEPETEADVEETEPGLIRELGLVSLILSTYVHGEASYMATEVREYEDRICLKISRTENYEVTDYEFCLPHKAGERYTDFAVDGVALRFDGEELKVLGR